MDKRQESVEGIDDLDDGNVAESNRNHIKIVESNYNSRQHGVKPTGDKKNESFSMRSSEISSDND